jgi:4-amino-4-deoxy-L-arabinose transferase-like glycosyltransferase
LIFLAWSILQFGGLFTPGLLDDVDSIYIQIAREMLQRHDFVTPTIDGIRFFDKPPLMYWMAAGSMHVFGVHDWAARLPLALGVLVLLLAVYALGLRLFAAISPSDRPDRAALYSALAMGISIGPYLYTRFYIPDILVALWMTLAVHLFLIALDRIEEARSALLPMLGFAAVLAFSVLTKGLIGLVFPVAFVFLYLLITRRLRLLTKLHPIATTLAFTAIAAPWHVLAALRNPPIAMPAGLGLPARAGWTWFYLYNEHIARFLGQRIPHDYGNVPLLIFWLLLLLWLVPWTAFLPAAILDAVRELRAPRDSALRFDSDVEFSHASETPAQDHRHEAALSLLLWAAIILGFFTVSSRQEYYHLPALPALALLVGGLLAAADRHPSPLHIDARLQAQRGSLYFLVPLGALLFLLCGYLALTAPTPAHGAALSSVLSSNPADYNLSLGHLFDLTRGAMGFFRGPLLTVALCMLALGPGSHLLRRSSKTFAANILLAAAMTGVLLAAHEGLARFYPILGSKDIADAIKAEGLDDKGIPLLIDGELTSGSSLLFYTDNPVFLINGRVNGPWFGSFWPDAPQVFLNDKELENMWRHHGLVLLMTYHPEQRIPELCTAGAPVVRLASSGGKTLLVNGVEFDDSTPRKSNTIDLCP